MIILTRIAMTTPTNDEAFVCVAVLKLSSNGFGELYV